MSDERDTELEDLKTETTAETPKPSEPETVGGGEAAETPEDRIAALEAETAELKDKLLRTLAEADNVRKRAEREVKDERTYAIERFARDLLSVSDNFARALDTLTDDDKAQMSDKGRSLFTGVEMTQKELHAVFARHGIVAVDAAPGAAFDPNMHQAVAQVPSDQPKDTIHETFAPGWKIGDRVLRAAMVAVSAGQAN